MAVRSAWSRCVSGSIGRGGVIHSSTDPAGGRICSVVAAGVVAVNVLVICLPTRLFTVVGESKRGPGRWPQGSLSRGHSRIV